MEFVTISEGEFIMGAPKDRWGRDREQVKVNISKPFEMMITEITQEHWLEVMGKNPSRFKSEKYCRGQHRVISNGHLGGLFGKIELCPDHPVENVSWKDVQNFIFKFNQQKNDGYFYRLPTEAEWEYAARAGTTTAYFFGEDRSNLGGYAWYLENAKGNPDYSFRRDGDGRVWASGGPSKQTSPVGQKRANPYGLYDMSGNVWEWVQDSYAENLPGETDPLQSGGRRRIIRGGSAANARCLFFALLWPPWQRL